MRNFFETVIDFKIMFVENFSPSCYYQYLVKIKVKKLFKNV